ncbi:DNA-binding response regulator, NarL/FixJ family, contains REC and HTH domains [Nonomuraea maritima]|uniref:DNA-binding response regulator, NarL/FixJ family, contains REC and HTH domains n=1 Tax=Nonomuraea maritima TaxID=683260 RepID=A0A1G9CT70_9ACTN|nr:response regulator transcription factor [Nonomuraea maritima]SDK54911.1 DNA-binding response regulator, NarL/FixJ family, contains REC and HTH domains [Nonomuraea maritima]
MPDRVSVIIAEDDDLLRASLRELVDSDPGLLTVAEARDGGEAVAAADRLRPGVVLMDIRMPGTDGLAATAAICARHPATRVVVLTTFDLDEYVYEALRAGAAGFLLKNTPPAQIVRAIHVVHEGDAMLAPEVTRRMIAGLAERRPARGTGAARFDALTERERDVVAAIVRGLSNEEIAAALFLSRATVKTYLSRLFVKVGVRDRTQLVILAYESGFVESLR